MQVKWTPCLLCLALLAALVVPASLQAAPQANRPAAAPKAAPQPAPQDTKVAVVNGTPIYKSEVEREAKSAKFQREASGTPMGEEELKALPDKVLNQLIGRTLLYQTAEKKGIKVTDQALKERTDIWRKQYPPQASMDEIYQRMGMTEATVQAEIKKGLMIEQLLGQTIPKNIEISDKEILEYVEKHLKDQVREEVREEKVNQAIEKYVNDLRGKAQVEVLVKKAP